MPDYSIVYVLTNSAMPGLVKIGRTSQADTATRLSQLYTTGVPVPFELKFACRVQNPDEVELAMHTAFGHSESIQGGNFFELIPSRRLQSLGCFTPRMLLQKWLLKRWGSTKSHWPPPKFFAHVARIWTLVKWASQSERLLNVLQREFASRLLVRERCFSAGQRCP